jgi:hypothetical protein
VRRNLGVAVVPMLALPENTDLSVRKIGEGAAYRRILALHRRSNTNPLLPVVLDVLRHECELVAAGWLTASASGPG